VNLMRRGACPGISDPMSTGDGLLVRLMPSAPIPLDAFVALCEASQAHGNGIMEVTQRGSLQVRGLSPASAPVFARTAIALGLGAEGGPPILTSPLLGLDAQERVDLRSLVTALRTELTDHTEIASIGPKVSVLIDGGSALHLDNVPADLRLQVSAAVRFHVSIAGNAAAATSLGWAEPHQALEVIVHVLATIANRGAGARARDFANSADAYALRTSLASVLTDDPPPPPRPPAEPIGTHRLNNGRLARGVALAFGYAEAPMLKRFAQAAVHCGATSIRPAPGRALLAIGLSAAAAAELAAAAMVEGLIVQPDDARRYVVACAGAPTCGSAMLATRQLAPHIAEAAKPFLDGSITIHVSGCAKGCAHPGAAALTLVGPDRLVVQGCAGDTPHGTTSATNFIAGLQRLHAEQERSLATLVPNADFLSRLGAIQMMESLDEESGRD
jgi:precorrin-3B synthase